MSEHALHGQADAFDVFAATDGPSDPLCTVCIANYNGEDLLEDCLDSIYAQSAGLAVEIIVHDDASSDASLALLRRDHPRVTVLASRRNVGFCVSNNRMADVARGDYLLFLNNDAALFPDAIQALVAHSGQQSNPGIVTLPQFDWRSGELVDRGAMLDVFYNPIPNLDSHISNVAMAIGACLWIPQELWRALGGFPEWMESLAEDMYLCCQARLQGYGVQVAAGSGYRHWQGKSFSGDRLSGELLTTFKRRRLSERNKTFVLFVMTPTALMWPILGLHLGLLLLEGVLLSGLRRDPRLMRKIYWPALLSPFTNRRMLLRHRAEQQAMRKTSLAKFFSVVRPGHHKLWLLLKHGLPRIV